MPSPKTTRNGPPLTIILLLVVALTSGFLLLNRTSLDFLTNQNNNSETQDKTGIPTCPREEPYPNPPELQEAIHLVEDRLGQTLATNKASQQMALLSNNWFNCINAQYKKLPAGVEGAFVFDENSSIENLQIFVDTDYQHYPDLLRAMLLAHELRHVLQFLETQYVHKTKSCVDQEVEAFMTQYLFFAALNENEKTTLADSAKRQLTNPAYAPIINMHLTFQTARRACPAKDQTCLRQGLETRLRSMILETPYYQNQCQL